MPQLLEAEVLDAGSSLAIGDYAKFAVSAVPWLLAIAGWLYAAHKADVRETRKELRAEIAEISALIQKVNDKLKEFRATDLSNMEKAILRVAILCELQHFLAKSERLISDLSGKNSTVDERTCKTNLTNYYELASGDYLETGQDISPVDAETYHFEVYTAGAQLENSIYQLFRLKFPSTKGIF